MRHVTGKIRQSAWNISFFSFVAIILIGIGFIAITNALFLGFGDFIYYLQKSRTWINFFNTVWTVSISTTLSMLIGIPVGYTLSRYQLPCSKLLKTLIDLPVMVPPAAVGVFLLGMFKTVPVSNITDMLGIKVVHALPGVIVAQFTVTVSFCIRLVMASFDAVNPKYEQVARSLGASAPRVFLKVSLPMAKSGLLAGLIIVWARAAAEWESLMLFVGGIQGKTDVLPFAVYLDLVGGKLGWALTTSLFCMVIAVASMSAVYYIGGKKYA